MLVHERVIRSIIKMMHVWISKAIGNLPTNDVELVDILDLIAAT